LKGGKGLDTPTPKIVFQPFGDNKTLEIAFGDVHTVPADTYWAEQRLHHIDRLKDRLAEAERLLRALVVKRDAWMQDTGYADGEECQYCLERAWALGKDFPHRPDCEVAKARAFLAGKDGAA